MVAQATCSPARSCWIRAFERATSEKLIPYRVDATTWTVKTYTVRVIGAGWSDLVCTCPAGSKAKVCKHQAVVAAAISRGLSPIKGTEKGKEVAIATPAPAAFVPASVLIAGVAPSLAEMFA